MSDVKRYQIGGRDIPASAAVFLPSEVVSSADYDALLAERDQLRAETDTLKTAVEFNRAPDDAEFGPGHPVFELAAENDRLRAERDSHQRLCIAEMEKSAQLRAELEAIRGQQPDAVSVPRELLESHLQQVGEYSWDPDSVGMLRALLSTKNAEEEE